MKREMKEIVGMQERRIGGMTVCFVEKKPQSRGYNLRGCRNRRVNKNPLYKIFYYIQLLIYLFA